MPCASQSYLTCSGCHELAIENDNTLFGETDLCVRAEAEDLGWKTGVGGNQIGDDEQHDYCPTCVEKGLYQKALDENGWKSNE